MVAELTKQDVEVYFAGLEAQQQGGPAPRIDFPPHVVKILGHLRYRFVTGPGAMEWDGYELMAYAPQCLRLRDITEVAKLYIALRERHTFRPSVADLRVAIDELHGVVPLPEPLPGHVIESRKVYRVPEEMKAMADQNTPKIAAAAVPDAEGRPRDKSDETRDIMRRLADWKDGPKTSREDRALAKRRAHGHRDDQAGPGEREEYPGQRNQQRRISELLRVGDENTALFERLDAARGAATGMPVDDSRINAGAI